MSTEPASRDRPLGGENLEVMSGARNYNGFLRSLVRRYSGGADTALDYGAGIGTFSDSLDVPAHFMHCVEPDSRSRTVLRDKGFKAHADIADLHDQSVPYAFTLNVLEHIDDDAAALAELYRVLTPGGRLFVYVPAFDVLFTSMDRHVGHLRRYRLPLLESRVRDAGFRIEKSAYADALGFIATLFLKLFDKPEPAPLNPGLVFFYDRVCFPLSRLLSVPMAKIAGKNAFVVANKPGKPA
ncbi:MAG: methyltransferase domain-containing protein [Woeseiaceae bacterium]